MTNSLHPSLSSSVQLDCPYLAENLASQIFVSPRKVSDTFKTTLDDQSSIQSSLTRCSSKSISTMSIDSNESSLDYLMDFDDDFETDLTSFDEKIKPMS